MTDETADLIGVVAGGKYRVVGRIGAGSMGLVYEAEHVEQGHHVALKVLRVDDKTIAARFLREAKTMSLFRHVNIIELLEVGALDDGTLFFATELVRGGTLRDLLAVGPIESRRALAIIRQVLDALGHAHALGVVHRDIKPENIMLADGGGAADLVKILDFGVAKLIGDTPAVLGEGTLTIAGYGALGTPYYMSPEAVLGRVIDARADLYSVGAMLFEMLTGGPPFTHEDVSVLMRMHAAAPIPTLRARAPGLAATPELELVVAEALSKKAELRFKSAAEMITALDAASRSLEPPEPPAVAPDDAPRRPSRTRKAEATDLFGNVPLRAPSAPAPASIAPPSAFERPATAPPGVPVARAASAPAIAEPIAPSSPPAPAPPGAPLFAPPMPARLATGGGRVALLQRLALQHRKLMFAGMGAFVLIIVVALVVAKRKAGDSAAGASKPEVSSAAQGRSELAQQAAGLLAAGQPARAVAQLEREELGDDAAAHLVLGHARVAAGRRLDGLASYERAISLAGRLAKDPEIRTALAQILETRDAVAGVVALELAARLDPPAHDLIKAQAGAGKVAEVRRRAFAIAEREKITDGIDRVASWNLDLAQATTCEDRLGAVLKLRRAGDPRAIPALRRARSHRCVEREVVEAISALEARPSKP